MIWNLICRRLYLVDLQAACAKYILVWFGQIASYPIHRWTEFFGYFSRCPSNNLVRRKYSHKHYGQKTFLDFQAGPTTNCRFSSYFFGGRFLASLATWFDCHLDAGFHTDGPALRALPKDHLNVGLVAVGDMYAMKVQRNLFEDPLMFHYYSSIWYSIGYWFPTTKNLQVYFMETKIPNVTYLFFEKNGPQRLHHPTIVLPYCWWTKSQGQPPGKCIKPWT